MREESKVENPEKDSMNFDEMSFLLMKEEEEKKIYDTEFGFSRIVELMIESKIPLIGHNCMYDICFFYR